MTDNKKYVIISNDPKFGKVFYNFHIPNNGDENNTEVIVKHYFSVEDATIFSTKKDAEFVEEQLKNGEIRRTYQFTEIHEIEIPIPVEW